MNPWTCFWWAFGRAWKFARSQRIAITRQQTRAFDRQVVIEFARRAKTPKDKRRR